jgi:hypothetical protein
LNIDRKDSKQLAGVIAMTAIICFTISVLFFMGYTYISGRYMLTFDKNNVSKTTVQKFNEARSILQKSYYEKGFQSDAKLRLNEYAFNISEPSLKAIIYEGLADLYEKEKDDKNNAYSLLRVIDLTKNNKKHLFNMAYSFSKAGKKYNKIAMYYYTQLINIDSSNDMAFNNLSVLYSEFGLQGLAVKNHYKAIESNNTLSMANIGYKFLNDGFVSMAKDMVDKARKATESPHQNISHLEAEIAMRESEEKEKLNKVERSAKIEINFLIEFSKAKFSKSFEIKNSNWKSNDNKNYEINGIRYDNDKFYY